MYYYEGNPYNEPAETGYIQKTKQERVQTGLVACILNRCPYDHVFWNRLKISGFDVTKIKQDKRKSKLGKKQFLGSYFTKAELTKIYNTVVKYEDQYWYEVIVDESTLTKAK